jgi:hypothetical protein
MLPNNLIFMVFSSIWRSIFGADSIFSLMAGKGQRGRSATGAPPADKSGGSFAIGREPGVDHRHRLIDDGVALLKASISAGRHAIVILWPPNSSLVARRENPAR